MVVIIKKIKGSLFENQKQILSYSKTKEFLFSYQITIIVLKHEDFSEFIVLFCCILCLKSDIKISYK